MSKQEETVVVNPELNQEIEGAVTDAVEKVEAERAAAAEGKEDPPPAAAGEKQDDQPPEENKGGKTEEGAPAGIPDDLIERAIHAGIPMKDVREIKNPEILGRMCEKLESAVKPADERKPGSDEKQDEGGDDPLDGVPDLDPEEYDEKIVAGFKAMKDIIRKQQAVIAKLGDGAARREESTIDTRLNGLGKAFADAAPAGSEKRAELEKKINILKAGYKAAGEDVEEDAVFQEAVKIVLGDVEDSEADARKAAALDKRRKLHLNRPSGSSFKAAGDVLSDVAAEIDAKFGKN